MLNKKVLGLLTFATLAYSGFSQAQSATANFNANSQIAAAITLANTASLNFGNVVPGTGGTVAISSTGVRTLTGGLVAAGGTTTASAFNVSGTPSTAYTITLPASASLTGPGAPMSVAFSAGQVTGGSLSRTLSAGGTDTFSSGGTLTVANAQTAGTYSGVFTMTVAY
jgi:hypothetical protein